MLQEQRFSFTQWDQTFTGSDLPSQLVLHSVPVLEDLGVMYVESSFAINPVWRNTVFVIQRKENLFVPIVGKHLIEKIH